MKPITVDSLHDLVYVEDVRISPDGSQAAFVRVSIDRGGNKNVRNIWVKHLRDLDAPAQPFTSGQKDSRPRWTRDGSRLGFISGRDGDPKVYAMPVAGGEAHPIATHRNGVQSFEWSHDGKRIAFVSPIRADERKKEDEQASSAEAANETSPKDAWDMKREKEQREHEDLLRYDPTVLAYYPYRTGTEYTKDRWAHVYVAPVPEQLGEPLDAADAKPRRVTDGDLNFEQPSWSPDGKALFSAVTRDPDSGVLDFYTDAIRLSPDAPDRAYQRLTSAGFTCSAPELSPDGQWLAFIRILEEKPVYHNAVLSLMPAGGSEADIVDVTDSLDREVAHWTWSKDGVWLYFTLIADGAVDLYRARAADRSIERITQLAHEILWFDVAADGRVAFIASTPGDPAALYLREADGAIQLLYQPNAKFLAEHEVRPAEEIRYVSDPFTIQGWIITPPGYDPAKRHPLALEIHGGPSAMWSAGTRSMWHEWQALAHRGYVVFFCNPRGSGGYGEAFLAANYRDWGDGPARDILHGVDEVVARGAIDTRRLAMTGGSYGGYMTAWIVGHDHRFAAAVAQRGVYNLVSMRGTTDIGYFSDWHFGATPFDDVNLLWQHSPLAYAPQVRTPLLIEHSELDFRVPIEQAEQLFHALKTLKKTVELVRWPREGHELSRSGEPKHRAERVRRILDWFDRYTLVDGQ